MGEENQPILGENCGVVTSPKITRKRDKNNHDQHPNTLISFKKGIHDFSPPPKLAALAAATNTPSQEETYLKLVACLECLSEWRVRKRRENQKHERKRSLKGQLEQT